jgi:hypothetical protein
VIATGAGVGAASPTIDTIDSTSPVGCQHGDVCAANLSFGQVTLGTYATLNPVTYEPPGFYLRNITDTSTVTVDLSTGVSFSGPGANDYVLIPPPAPNCHISGHTVTMTPRYNCFIGVDFYPGALGDRSATATITASDGSKAFVNLSGTGSIGYYQVDEFGDVANYGDAAWLGDAGNDTLNAPIVAMASTGDNGGYWLVASDGGIFSYGDAAFYGSTGNLVLNQPIVGMAATPDGHGYWLVAADGGIFSYGDAGFYGSTGNLVLNQPIVGMAATPDGHGYWLVASDGGIFAYGDAGFYGSTGNLVLNQPVVGMAATPDGHGYWLVASDGGIFAYNAPFYGSTGNLVLNEPIVGMAPVPDGSGYWFSAADGGLFSYNAPFYGSGATDPNLDTVVDMTTDGSPPLQAWANSPAVRAQVAAHGLGTLGIPRFAGPLRSAR